MRLGCGPPRIGKQSKLTQQGPGPDLHALATLRVLRRQDERTFLHDEARIRFITGPKQDLAAVDVPALDTDGENAQSTAAQQGERRDPFKESDVIFDRH